MSSRDTQARTETLPIPLTPGAMAPKKKNLEIHNQIDRVPNPALHPDCAFKFYVQLPRKEQDLSLRASQLSSAGSTARFLSKGHVITPPLHP